MFQCHLVPFPQDPDQDGHLDVTSVRRGTEAMVPEFSTEDEGKGEINGHSITISNT